MLGLINAGIDTILFRGKAPWTLRNHHDHEALQLAAHCQKIDYPKPDGVVSFDKPSSVFLSNTNHEENQPVHLKLNNSSCQSISTYACTTHPNNAFVQQEFMKLLQMRKERTLNYK